MSKVNQKINFVQILVSIMLSKLTPYIYTELMKLIESLLKHIKQYLIISKWIYVSLHDSFYVTTLYVLIQNGPIS